MDFKEKEGKEVTIEEETLKEMIKAKLAASKAFKNLETSEHPERTIGSTNTEDSKIQNPEFTSKESSILGKRRAGSLSPSGPLLIEAPAMPQRRIPKLSLET